MNTKRYLLGGTLAALGIASGLLAQEQAIKSKDVPNAVVSAVGKAYPNAKIRGWEKEMKGGKAFYEASVMDGAVKRDVLFTADGTQVEAEETIAVNQLPSAVRGAIQTKYPRATIRGAEKLTKGQDTLYEVALTNASTKEVVLTADGKFTQEQEED